MRARFPLNAEQVDWLPFWSVVLVVIDLPRPKSASGAVLEREDERTA